MDAHDTLHLAPRLRRSEILNHNPYFGKPFDFMTYPDRTHSINEGPGTTVHLYHLLARYLTEHLPAGPQ